MKHLLFLVSLFLTINASAHHLTALGWCQTGNAFFRTEQFSNGLNVQIQYRTGNGTWLTGPTFNTPTSGNTATTFSVPQSVNTQLVSVRFRYKPITIGVEGLMVEIFINKFSKKRICRFTHHNSSTFH